MINRRGEAQYVRARDLPRLLGLWPREVATLKGSDLDHLVARLDNAIRAERRRALSRDWTYDLTRHWALLRARDAERAELLRHRRRMAWERLRSPPAQPPAGL